jgi:L-alanine-DL-glutamate epimerase-like enolase superfamily enzyme
MKITGIETVLFERTWDHDPYAAMLRRVNATITIYTDEGLTGISRTVEANVPLIHDYLKPVLIGEDPRNVERLWAKMEHVTVPMLGRERAMIAAIGSVDIALWDLYGKSVGLPCWQILGGYRDWVPAYADIPIRSRTPEGLGEELADCVANGYLIVKFHILQNDPDHIVAETRAARAAIGPDVKLIVDIFRALDPRTAIDVARRIEEYDIYWLEEPVRWHDQPLGLAIVAAQTSIPIGGGEGESSIYACRSILEQGGVSYLQTDTIYGGGFTNVRKIANLAAAYHVKFAPHGATFPELASHLVAAVPNGENVPATTPHFPPAVWADLYEDFAIMNGKIQLSARPGLGLTFNQDFLDRYRVASLD